MSEIMQDTGIFRTIAMRRTVKPDKMNGKVISDETITEVLKMADWAPTHARTEPWRFIVIGSSKVQEFASRHADLYKEFSNPVKFTPEQYNKIKSLGDNVSHIMIAWMKRIPTHKIPEVEEISATAAAIQNLLLAATAKGIGSFWSTSGMTHHESMKKEFGLGDEDKILGIIYFGYTDEPFKEGTRMTPLSEKIEWVR